MRVGYAGKWGVVPTTLGLGVLGSPGEGSEHEAAWSGALGRMNRSERGWSRAVGERMSLSPAWGHGGRNQAE